MGYRVQLPNGLRIVGEENPTVRSVSVGIWIGTGSRYETPQNNGISHFLEHMLFKGTEHLNARELALVFDELGGQVNAFTSKEYTCFYAKVLDEHFVKAAETLADMLFHSRFAPDEIEKEKNVVIEEIRMYEDTPDELVLDVLSQGVFGDHPLGFTILGGEGNLRAFTREDITSYVASRYTPGNTVISVVGNVAEGQAVEAIHRLFGAWRATPALVADGPPVFEQSLRVRTKDTEQVHVCLASPGFAAGDPRMYALILLSNALGGSSSSRLFQSIREERGLAYSVYSFHSAYRDCGMFGIYTATSPDRLDEVMRLIRDTCQDMAQHGMTAEELRRGKEQVKGSLMLGLESTSSRMTRLGKNELLLGREVPLDETLAGINAVTAEDVRDVARAVLGGNFAVAAVGPVEEDQLAPWM
ncbi:MAG: insulinase family protein [Thermoflavifilum sp.]|nr:insulinase family protein [Thermoflavifilum sp.]MCL6513426.1 insulinase family protein [Alicyclobacillus sp.]